MIEEIPRGMREEAVWNAAARRLAEGRSVESVRLDLGKRGWSAVEIEKNWPEIESRFLEFIGARKKRLRLLGACWLLVGLVIPAGLVWSFGTVPMILILSVIPVWYGFYLLGHRIDCEPQIEAPVLFGRNL